MTETKKVSYILFALMGIIFVPYIGSYIYHDGVFDTHYFDFPPLKAEFVYDNFSWTVFITVSIVFFLTILLYIFPTLFGFKKVKTERPSEEILKNSVPFPIWFWIGGIVWAGSFIFLLCHFTTPKWFLNWAYIPLYWGFTFMLDGIVYKRTRGKSIFNNAPQELIGIGVSSIGGWLIFEYLNFFVQEYWYYPMGNLVPDDEFCTYAIFASSALMPLCFEWYSLFNTFPKFVNKYKNGPKIVFNKTMQMASLILAFVGLFFMSFYPTWLCPIIWLSPLVIIAATLSLLGIWNPFTSIKNGNWTPFLFMALTYLLEGFLLEGQNYISASHANGVLETSYPGYWVYNVPFVNRFHIFEMPVVGFYGYLPFGVYCLVWWIAFAYLLKIPTNFAKYESPEY